MPPPSFVRAAFRRRALARHFEFGELGWIGGNAEKAG